MSAFLAPFGGAVIAAALLIHSLRLRQRIVGHEHAFRWWLVRWMWIVSAAFGAVSGWVVARGMPTPDTGVDMRSDSISGALLFSIVSGLAVVQVPLDLTTRRLSRPATVLAAVAAALVITVHAIAVADISRSAGTLLLTIATCLFFWLAHRWSPASLGFGDVLLSVPIVSVLSWYDTELLLPWLLLASASGAVHAVVVWLVRRTRSIPFGPHLILSAWLLLVMGYRFFP